MNILRILVLLGLAASVWAAPSLTDLDSWQLPEEEEAAPAKPAVSKPAVTKASTPVKKDTSNEPELEVQLAGTSNYEVASSTRDASEIVVMHASASQLQNRLMGKSRFHVLFNANIPASVDKIITSEDGQEYAVVIFGNAQQNYRLFLFKSGVEQPLVAVAEDMTGKLYMYRQFHVNVGVEEEDFNKAWPTTAVQSVIAQDQSVYQVHQLPGSWSVIFKDRMPVKQFTNNADLVRFVNQLQGVDPEKEQNQIVQPSRSSRWLKTEKQATPKRLFSDIVASGTIWERRYAEEPSEMDTPWETPTRGAARSSSRTGKNTRRR